MTRHCTAMDNIQVITYLLFTLKICRYFIFINLYYRLYRRPQKALKYLGLPFLSTPRTRWKCTTLGEDGGRRRKSSKTRLRSQTCLQTRDTGAELKCVTGSSGCVPTITFPTLILTGQTVALPSHIASHSLTVQVPDEREGCLSDVSPNVLQQSSSRGETSLQRLPDKTRQSPVQEITDF